MMVAELQENFAQIQSVTKTRILFFYQSIVRSSPEDENRRSEKLHLTLKIATQQKA